MTSKQKTKKGMDRRSFLRSAAAAGAGLVFTPKAFALQGPAKTDDINIALIGAGQQGQLLTNACLKMGGKAGIRFKAVCDIWQSWNLQRLLKRLKAYDYQPATYTDYREMLDKQKDLDAVIIATPDFQHAGQTVNCLNAGLHVYCETEMSNTIEGAKKMAQAAKQTGKLLQIGRQKRSNPLYIHCCNKLIKDAKILGQITAVNGQHNSPVRTDLSAPKKYAIDQAVLQKYGFESMNQFRNWRWYKKLGSGPAVASAAHQIDVFNWFLGTAPNSVMAGGGTDYYDKKTHQWYDNVMAVYEYKLENKTVRALYQTITTNSSQGHFEKFMGNEGTLIVSETSGESAIYREDWVPPDKWDKWVEKGYLEKTTPAHHPSDDDASLAVQSSVAQAAYDFPVSTDKPYHQLHLENFFAAVRGKEQLNCPALTAYKSAVAVLKLNEAIEAGKKLNLSPADFEI